MARLALDWPHLPPPLFTTPRADHPLERDLDLVGPHSLHHLIDTTVSHEGGARLRDWLAAGEPDPEQASARQVLVRELIARPIFRDKLRLNAQLSAGPAHPRWHGSRLVEWLSAIPAVPSSRPMLILLTALAALNGVLLVLDALAGFPALWRVSFMIYIGLYLWRVNQIADPFSLGLALRDPLEDLKAVFTYLETAHYETHPALRACVRRFWRLSADLRSIWCGSRASWRRRACAATRSCGCCSVPRCPGICSSSMR